MERNGWQVPLSDAGRKYGCVKGAHQLPCDCGNGKNNFHSGQ